MANIKLSALPELASGVDVSKTYILAITDNGNKTYSNARVSIKSITDQFVAGDIVKEIINQMKPEINQEVTNHIQPVLDKVTVIEKDIAELKGGLTGSDTGKLDEMFPPELWG